MALNDLAKEDNFKFSWQSSNSAIEAKKWGYRNIYALSISVVTIFTGFYGLVSLQSSINPTIGAISLSVHFTSAAIGAFISPSVLTLFGSKNTILLGYFGNLIYTLANYYPAPYILIPATLISGLTSKPLMWSALYHHTTKLAILIASALKESNNYLISNFTGILNGFYVFSFITGNLASSLILYPYTQTEDSIEQSLSNSSHYDNSTAECNIDGSDIEKLYIYILTSVYAVIQVIAIITLLAFVDQLPKDTKFFSNKKKLEVFFTKPLKNIFSILTSVRMLLLTPVMLLSGLETSFALGTFTQVYISDCFGTYQVGFTIMVLGASSTITAFIYGRLSKYIPQFIMVLFGCIVMLILISFLLVWDRVRSYAVIFSFAVGWGIGDGIWSTQNASLSGILFPKKLNAAFSAYMAWYLVGNAIGYAMSELAPVKGQLGLILVTVTITLIGSFIVEVVYLRHSPHHPWCGNSAAEHVSDSNLKPDTEKDAVELSTTNPCDETSQTTKDEAAVIVGADTLLEAYLW